MKTLHLFAKKATLVLALTLLVLYGYSQTETLPSGSFIINMGTPTQTFNNGLRPYGLIWDIIKNNKAQVKWVISQTKLKDGVDFTYNAVNYSGGTFVIPQKFITPSVQAKINALFPSVIAGVYTTSPLTVNVTYTLKYTPRWTFDFDNGSIAQAYLTNAGIPLTGFPLKLPSQLNGCDDLFIMPHADPVWSTHNNLLTWNANNKGWIWAACHATSAMENIYNPANPAQQLNFLSQNFAGFGVDQDAGNTWAGNSLVLWTKHADPIVPYTYAYPNDPIMQFMGLVDGSVGGNGSERAYMPYNATSGGAAGRNASWRPSTKVAVYDNSPAATNPNIPEFSNGLVAEIAYGRAFGNANYGSVMYEAGHNHNSAGTDAEKVAAQRAFLNFSFLSTYDKDPEPVPAGASNIFSGVGGSYSISLAKPGFNLADYSIQWSSNCAGTFSNPIGVTTTYTPSTVASCVTCVLTVTITDACGRQFYETLEILVCPSPPVAIDLATNIINNPPGTGQINLGSTTPLAGTDPDGTIVSYMVTTLPLASQGVLYYNNGTSVVVLPVNTVLTVAQMATLAFDPADGFGGYATFNYTVIDNSALSDLTPATYTIPVNPPPVAQDFITALINSNAAITPIGASLFATDNGSIVSYTISSLPLALEGILYLNGIPVMVGQILTPAQASQLSFDPTGTFVGYAPFTYTATDNNGLSDPTPATVTIQIVNQAPIAQDITSPVIANPNGTGQTAIPSLQAIDADGTIASYTVMLLPLNTEGILYYFNGTTYVPVTGGQVLTPAQASSLRFDPVDGFMGNASFTYTATDNNGLVDNTPATYNIPVGITPPLAADITNPAIYSGAGQTAINPLVGNDPDATDVIVNYTITTLPAAAKGILYYNNGTGFVPVIAGVALTPAQMATLKFDPTDGATGNAIFNYTVTDDEGLSDLSPATYTIPLTNIAPIANIVNSATLNSTDGPTAIDPLSGSDVDGTITNYIITSLPNASQGILLLTGVPVFVGQILTPAQASQLSFDPAPGSSGTAIFSYTVKDDQGAVDATPATFSIPINTILTPPVANDITNTAITINAGATSILPLTATDADGTIVSFTITTIPPAAQGILYLNGVAVTAGQIITLAQATQLSFDPSGTYIGNVVFNYTATDNSGLVDATPAVVAIPVVNTPPVAQNVSIPQIKTGSTVKIAPLVGTDVDGTISTFTISTLPTLGTLQVDLTGTGVFTAVTVGQVLTPAQAARLRILSGAVIGTSTFTYTTTDNNGAIDLTPATYTIPIGANADPLGQPPFADDKLNTAINANAGVTPTLPLTATDPDGSITSYTILTVPPPYTGTLYYLAGGTVLTAITTGGFSLTPAEALTVRFDPSSTFVGNASFTYTAIDNSGNIDPTPATYIIPIINTPPVATNITNASIASTAGATTISSLAATDADGTIATYTVTTLPLASQGVLSLNGVPLTQGQIVSVVDAAKIKFDPNPLFSGNATFTFTATDNLGAVDATPAIFTIPVANQPPVTDDKISQVITNTIGTGQQAIPALSGTDADGSVVSFTINSLPPNGVLYVNGVVATIGMVVPIANAGLLTFDPADGFAGTSNFNYSATDNNGNTDATPAVYQIISNTPPTTNNITAPAMISGGANAGIPPLVATDNGSIQSYTIITLPPASQGVLYLNGVAVTSLSQVATLTALQITQLSFTPAATFTGTAFIYTATDNLGIADVTPANYSIPLSIVVSGTVHNDVNGLTDGNVNGAGTSAGGSLYVSLVNASNVVIATLLVAADGTYSFVGINAGNYTVVLHQTAAGSTVASLPTGWVNTGEDCCDNIGADGLINGSVAITVVTSNVINASFGIEQRPTANTTTASNQFNPGGTTSVTVPATTFGGTDPSGGTMVSIRITAFPTNANSLTIDGVVYTTLAAIQTAYPTGIPTNAAGNPMVPILVDPIDGVITVNIPFFVKDNAGFESLVAGSANIPFTHAIVTGNVFNDVNGLSNTNVDGAGTNATGTLYVSIVNASNVIVATAAVAANGTYTFNNIVAGNYTVVLHQTAAGSITPSIPAGWANTGEDCCDNIGSDGLVNGIVSVVVSELTLANLNFGIEELPNANANSLPAVLNPGGSISHALASTFFSGTDPSSGFITGIRITAFPTNATSITINGVVYTTLAAIQTAYPTGIPTNAAGNPLVPISVDPINGTVTVGITYTVIDNAGIENPTPATSTIEFLEPIGITGTIFNDIDGSANGTHTNIPTGTETGTNAGNTLYAYLVDPITNTVIGIDTVTVSGIWAFGSLTPNSNTRVIITTATAIIGATAPAATLPVGWTNTSPLDTTFNVGAPIPALINNINFGIEQPPTANTTTVTAQLNPGGTISVPIAASTFGGTDASGGIITAIKITVFPSNATSITINGVVFTTLAAIQTAYPTGIPTNATGQPTVPISVDPVNGIVTVTVPYVTIDNAGVSSLIAGAANLPFVNGDLNGTVFNDVNGLSNTNVDGTGTNVGGVLFVSLINASNVIVATSPVAADGTYSFNNIVAGNYTLVLHQTAAGSTVASLPSGWVNTGEDCCDFIGSDGLTNGILSVVVGSTSVANMNFGIEQPPTANTATATAQTNPGGTTSVTIPATTFGGTDASGGIISSIIITAFPSNATSITINGVVYTTLAAIQAAYPTGIPTNAAGQPNVPIAIDPIDGAVTVAISYVTVDNAGIQSPIAGVANIPFTTAAISGNVLNDVNGATDAIINGVGTNITNTLYVSLVDGTNAIIATVPVAANGSYSFPNVNGGNYTVVLHQTAAGSTVASLPSTWVNTAEGTTVAGDGTTNGTTAVSVTTGNVTNVNFGIEQPPTANTATATAQTNPGGTTSVTLPAATFGGTDASGGIISSIIITAFPTNATSITIDGVVYTTLAAIQAAYPIGIPTNAAGQPTVPIAIDPIDGAVTVDISYVTVDNAGVQSTSAGVANIPFTTATISGNVLNDVNGTTDAIINGTGTNITNTLYVSLVDATNTINATVAVAADGTYSFPNLNGGNYTVVLHQTAAGSTIASLPSTWVNIAEGIIAAGDGTTNGITAVSVTTGNVTNVNFGIEQPPVANIATAASQTNPGGTISVTVPAATFGGTDASGGIISSIIITPFPTNATTITINGTTYTAATFPVAGVTVPTNATGQPTQAISIDPIDGAVTVEIAYVTVDNAGIPSTTAGTANVPFTTAIISGNVFNDVNGTTDAIINGVGTNISNALYVSLVDASNNIVSTIAVSSTGAYSIAGISVGNYTIVLHQTASGSTVPSLPTGWVNTAEGTTAAGDGTTNGVTALSVTTGDITNVNFGIEELPNANSNSIPAVLNPGGTNNYTLPSTFFSGTDPSGGIISNIRITVFPTNVTSITIDGTTYTSATFPVGGVTVATNAAGNPLVPISVDPINGNVIVGISYTVIDNAGIEDPTPATSTVEFLEPIGITGTIFNDIDGSANGTHTNIPTGTETGTNAGNTLYAYLIDPVTNTVLDIDAVTASGIWAFSGLTPNSNVKVIISTTIAIVGGTAPAATLPLGWTNTSPLDTTFNLGTQNPALISNLNFGIEQPPTANTITLVSQTNPGGTTSVTVPASTFGGTDASGGIITDIKITTFPSNATTITINGTTYTAATFPVAGVTVPTNATGQPTQTISVDPIDGAVTVGISYVTIDNAGVPSTTFGIANIPFTTVNVSGNVFNDVNGTTDATINGIGTNISSALYVSLVDATNNIIATLPVASDGTYNFTNVNGGNYTVVLHQTATGSTVAALPSTWVNTAEGTTAAGDGTANGVTSITVANTNVITNFGIEQPPTVNSSNVPGQTNPGGTLNVIVPSTTFGGTDASGGIITSINITTFPLNATTITINGITYTSATFPVAGVAVPTNATGQPTQIISVDPINGFVTVVLSYVTIDNAGIPSTTQGNINLLFTGVVPIKITSFTAIPKGTQVNLQWIVSVQINVAAYEVEFSNNGRNFDKIATVTSNGNQGATYDAVHTSPITGINFYRIKTIENDGTINYSEIRRVNFGKGGEIIIYPNPASTGVVNITLTGSMIGKAATVSIISMDGKLISQQKIVSAAQTETLDVSKLAKETYVVRIVTDTEVVNKTIEVIR